MKKLLTSIFMLGVALASQATIVVTPSDNGATLTVSADEGDDFTSYFDNELKDADPAPDWAGKVTKLVLTGKGFTNSDIGAEGRTEQLIKMCTGSDDGQLYLDLTGCENISSTSSEVTVDVTVTPIKLPVQNAVDNDVTEATVYYMYNPGDLGSQIPEEGVHPANHSNPVSYYHYVEGEGEDEGKWYVIIPNEYQQYTPQEGEVLEEGQTVIVNDAEWYYHQVNGNWYKINPNNLQQVELRSVTTYSFTDEDNNTITLTDKTQGYINNKQYKLTKVDGEWRYICYVYTGEDGQPKREFTSGNYRLIEEDGNKFFTRDECTYVDENNQTHKVDKADCTQIENEDGTFSYTYTYSKIVSTLTFQKIKDLINGVSFPDTENFTAIPTELLANATNLTTVVIPDNVKTIGDGSFQGCTKLTDVDFGNGVEIIGESAFERTGLTGTFEIPASVKVIRAMAFKACSKIVNIIIPEDSQLEHIYQFAFAMENPEQSSLKNVYVNKNAAITCDKGAFGFTSTDGQTQAGTVTTRLHYPPAFYEEYVGAYKTKILGGIFERQEQRLANRNYARAEMEVTGVDGKNYENTDYPSGNGWWEFLSTGIPVPYDPDWKVDYNDYWRTYSDFVDLTVPEGFAESSNDVKGINVYLVDGYDKDTKKAKLVRMKVGECIPAKTGVVIHWRVKVTDTTGGFIFFAPYTCGENEEPYLPYDNELYPNNKYHGYNNYMKPLSTRGEALTIQNVEKVNGVAQYRNFFWGNSEEFKAASAQSYKGDEFDEAGVSGWGFYRAISGNYTVNNKAFLHFPATLYDDDQGAGSGEDHSTDTNANAFSFIIVGEGSTGITNVNIVPETKDNSYYTLQGVKVNTPKEKGIYIHNGKKIIFK